MHTVLQVDALTKGRGVNLIPKPERAMTTHELAKLLLTMEDLPVGTMNPESYSDFFQGPEYLPVVSADVMSALPAQGGWDAGMPRGSNRAVRIVVL